MLRLAAAPSRLGAAAVTASRARASSAALASASRQAEPLDNVATHVRCGATRRSAAYASRDSAAAADANAADSADERSYTDDGVSGDTIVIRQARSAASRLPISRLPRCDWRVKHGDVVAGVPQARGAGAYRFSLDALLLATDLPAWADAPADSRVVEARAGERPSASRLRMHT